MNNKDIDILKSVGVIDPDGYQIVTDETAVQIMQAAIKHFMFDNPHIDKLIREYCCAAHTLTQIRSRDRSSNPGRPKSDWYMQYANRMHEVLVKLGAEIHRHGVPVYTHQITFVQPLYMPVTPPHPEQGMYLRNALIGAMLDGLVWLSNHKVLVYRDDVQGILDTCMVAAQCDGEPFNLPTLSEMRGNPIVFGVAIPEVHLRALGVDTRYERFKLPHTTEILNNERLYIVQ